MNIKKIILLPLLLAGFSLSAFAEGEKGDPEVLYKYQFGLDLEFKLAKGLKLEVGPELRYNEGFDKFLLNGGLSYKIIDNLSVGASYRLVVDRGESTSTTTLNSFGGFSGGNSYDYDTYHRFAFDLTYKDKIGRFTPSARVRYNNYSDDDSGNEAYMRYRAKVEYDIRKCIITPFLYAEAFQQTEGGALYKMRYSTGFDLKTGKNSALEFGYKFDYFLLKYKNANIFSLGFKQKF